MDFLLIIYVPMNKYRILRFHFTKIGCPAYISGRDRYSLGRHLPW